MVAASAVVLLVCALALAPGLFAGDPNATDPAAALQGPTGAHLLGTDQLGRDTLARIVHGAGASLGLGLGATALAAMLGVTWGLVAGLGGRGADEVAMRIADIAMSVPVILLALMVVAVLGPGGVNVAVAIAIAVAPGFARVVRVETIAVKDAAYVHAATILGRRRGAIILQHIIPNLLPTMLVLITIGVGQAVLAGASLSFLGLGPQPPTAEWGAMLSQSRDYLQTSWGLAVFPGLAITLTVISFAVLGRALQARIEGHRR